MSFIRNTLNKLFLLKNPIDQYKRLMQLNSDLVLFLDNDLSIIWGNQSFADFKKTHRLDKLDTFIPTELLATASNKLDTLYEFDFDFKEFYFHAKLSRLDPKRVEQGFVLVCYTTNHEQTIYDLKYNDVIIDGGNRTFYIEKLDEMYDQINANPHLSLLLLDIDFNNFDRVDHFYGHEYGDKVLRDIAKELISFDDKNIVSRTSGTNLILMHLYENSSFDKDGFIQQIVEVLSKPIQIDDDNAIQILSNIGAVILPQDAKDSNEALRHVTLAYEQSKKQYDKVAIAFYQESLGEQSSRYLEIEKKLDDAVTNNCLELYYQPKIDVKTKRIYGFEALLRWYDEDLGFVSPVDFVAVAEDTGQIVQIGLWVLQQVCLQTNAWQRQGFNFKTSLNVSVRQLQDANFINSFNDVLNKTGVDTSLIEVEITESVLSDGLSEITELFRETQQLGLSISLDDFGTSYSSLSYLKNLPIDILKIDRSFIKNSCNDSKDAAIAKTIVTLAKELKLEVIAEGVETADQVALLEEMECDYIQGYYYYKPMCIDDLELVLKDIYSS